MNADFIDKVKERYGDTKSELMNWADAWHAKSAPKPPQK